MNTNAFYQSYLDFAFQASVLAHRPIELDSLQKDLIKDSKRYIEYLGKFEIFFNDYPAVKTALFANLSNYKFGAFIEYRLDLLYAELEKVEMLKVEIKKEISGIRNDFDYERDEWLAWEEYEITRCYRYLDTGNIPQVIGFLNESLSRLRAKRQDLLDSIRGSEPKGGSKAPSQSDIAIRIKKEQEEQQEREREERKREAQKKLLSRRNQKK